MDETRLYERRVPFQGCVYVVADSIDERRKFVVMENGGSLVSVLVSPHASQQVVDVAFKACVSLTDALAKDLEKDQQEVTGQCQ